MMSKTIKNVRVNVRVNTLIITFILYKLGYETIELFTSNP